MNTRAIQLLLVLFLMITSTSYSNTQPTNPEAIVQPEVLSAKYETHFPIFIHTEEDFSYYGIPGSGISEDPYIIENYNITSMGAGISIAVQNVHIVIRNCFFSSPGTSYGLVSIEGYSNVTIEGCIFTGGDTGIRIRWTLGASIINNTITNMEVGMQINTNGNVIIRDNSVYQCSTGMDLSIHHSSVLNNKIYGNDRRGIQISEYSWSNIIQENEIGWNGGYFGFGGVDNADDDGSDNNWNGNSWSDYGGEGAYEIDGSANSEDNQPVLLTDTSVPQIVQPDDQSIIHGDPVHPIVWEVSDEFPWSYSTSINGNKSGERTWLGYSIETPIYDLTVGSYQITLNVTDYNGNSTIATVVVEVIQPLFTEDLGVTLLVVSVIAIIIIGFEVARRRSTNP